MANDIPDSPLQAGSTEPEEKPRKKRWVTAVILISGFGMGWCLMKMMYTAFTTQLPT